MNESDVISADGTTIHVYHWPCADAVASLLISHGLGEHAFRYDEMAQYLVSHKFNVVGFDHRGHGKSAGGRGNLTSIAAVNQDFEAVISATIDTSTPVFLFGHSCGGHLALQYLFHTQKAEFRGAIIDSPWLALAFEPPRIKVWAGRLVGRLFPSMALPNGLDPSKLSRVQAEIDLYLKDPLVHNKIAASTFLAVSSGCDALLNDAKFRKLDVPVLLVHGTADAICSQPVSKKWFDQLECADKEFVAFEGAYHELFKDECKDELFAKCAQWMQQRL